MTEKGQKVEQVEKGFSMNKKETINYSNSSPIIGRISACVEMEISICCYLLKNNNLTRSHHNGLCHKEQNIQQLILTIITVLNPQHTICSLKAHS